MPDESKGNSKISRSEEETKKIAQEIGKELKGGNLLLLIGEIGVGKTEFVKGLVKSLGGSEDDVTSPTFTIMQEYITPKAKILHVDLYRVENDPYIMAEIDERLQEGYIVVVEWGEKVPKDLFDEGKKRKVKISFGNDEKERIIEVD